MGRKSASQVNGVRLSGNAVFPNNKPNSEVACQRTRKNRTDQAQSRDAAHGDLREYALKYSALLPGSTNHAPEALHAELEAWSIANLTNLEDTQLAGQTDRAEKARLDAEQIFTHSSSVCCATICPASTMRSMNSIAT